MSENTTNTGSNRETTIEAIKQEQADLEARRTAAQQLSKQIAEAERRGSGTNQASPSVFGPPPIMFKKTEDGHVLSAAPAPADSFRATVPLGSMPERSSPSNFGNAGQVLAERNRNEMNHSAEARSREELLRIRSSIAMQPMPVRPPAVEGGENGNSNR